MVRPAPPTASLLQMRCARLVQAGQSERNAMPDGDHQQHTNVGAHGSATGPPAIALADAPILIVDDQPDIVQLLATILTIDGYRAVHTTTDPNRAGSLVATLRPHVVLLDLSMPGMDGYAVM